MPFPETPRMIYEINPLEEVFCQVRFPPILKIDAEIPHAFQERIRTRLPQYKTKSALQLPGDMPSDLASLMSKELTLGAALKTHEFASLDGIWSLSFTREALTLRCSSYKQWETFKGYFAEPCAALRDLYAPAAILRVGLRYKDVIRRSRLGLDGVGWEELLQPWVASAYTASDIRDDIEGNGHQLVLRLSDGRSHVLINYGTGSDPTTQEECYIIDADFYDDIRTEPADAIARLDFLHGQAVRLFRGCIKDRLHYSMRPRPLPSD